MNVFDVLIASVTHIYGIRKKKTEAANNGTTVFSSQFGKFKGTCTGGVLVRTSWRKHIKVIVMPCSSSRENLRGDKLRPLWQPSQENYQGLPQ